MKWTLILSVALLAEPAAAHDPWTLLDTTLEASGAALQLVDWSTTLNDARPKYWDGERWVIAVESWNPILGRRPSEAKVNVYFAGTLLAHAAIAYALPRPWRTLWQVAWIGMEADADAYNVAGGLRLELP